VTQKRYRGVAKLSDGLKPPESGDSEVVPQAGTAVPSPAGPSLPKDACAELATLARQAFQEKRRKECLVLTRSILAIDAENKEAQVIENWVRSDLQKDLEAARAVVQQASQEHDGELFQRAEWMIRMILRIDPNNAEANTLLQTIRTVESESTAKSSTTGPGDATSDAVDSTPVDLSSEYGAYPPVPSSRRGIYLMAAIALVLPVAGLVIWKYYTSRPPVPSAVTSAEKVAEPKLGVLDIALMNGVQVFINDEYRGTTPLEPLKLAPGVYQLRYEVKGQEIGNEEVTVAAGNTTSNTFREPSGHLVFIVVPATGVQLKIDGNSIGLTPESAEVKPGQHLLEFSAAGYAPRSMTATVAAGQRTMVPILLKPLSATDVAKPNALAVPPPITARAVVGTLSIGSPIAVDIYEGDKRLGATPAILQFPPGPHTLEYRHEGLKKSATYNIVGGVNTTVGVTFEIPVQINAYPYAEVNVEGNPMPLGETPLNRVSVPVGATLIFKHPKYPEKKYRVLSTDTAISINFP
jgi:hypothetical protein